MTQIPTSEVIYEVYARVLQGKQVTLHDKDWMLWFLISMVGVVNHKVRERLPKLPNEHYSDMISASDVAYSFMMMKIYFDNMTDCQKASGTILVNKQMTSVKQREEACSYYDKRVVDILSLHENALEETRRTVDDWVSIKLKSKLFCNELSRKNADPNMMKKAVSSSLKLSVHAKTTTNNLLFLERDRLMKQKKEVYEL